MKKVIEVKMLKDKKIIALIIVLSVFTLGYFILVNKVSYAFVQTSNLDELYEVTINAIKETSVVYAQQNMDKFENNILSFSVQDLVDNKLVVTNSEGEVANPKNSKEPLNSHVITVKYIDGKYEVKVDN